MLVHDKSPLKGEYKLGRVESVKMSQDGLVRSGVITYRIPNKDSFNEYTGGKLVRINRSVQRLSLILAVEEQPGQLDVVDNRIMQENKVKEV